MSFSSIEFIFYFLVIFFIGYYFLNEKFRNTYLLLFSILFYLFLDINSLPVLLIIALFNYLMTFKFNNKLALVASIIDVVFLIYFKIFSDFNIVGLSFFIFKQISYCLDVYKNRQFPEENLLNYLCYALMFVNIISGPIVPYYDLRTTIITRKLELEKGFYRFVLGLIEKVLLADVLGRLYGQLEVLYGESLTVNILMVLVYSLWLYLDFVSYSSMAIGLGKMLGFDFKENFNYPYLASSVSEFYQRWHISLANFFKDYVYIPLGGNRKGKFRLVLNIFIVWLLTGLWHGLKLSYLLWGLYFGLIISLEKLNFKRINKMPKFLRHLYTLVLVIIGWAIFSGNNIFVFKEIYSESVLFYLNNYKYELIISLFLTTPILKNFLIKDHHLLVEILISLVIIALFILSLASLLNNTYLPFLYAGF